MSRQHYLQGMSPEEVAAVNLTKCKIMLANVPQESVPVLEPLVKTRAEQNCCRHEWAPHLMLGGNYCQICQLHESELELFSA